MMPQFCSNHLAFNKGYYDKKNIQRTLGVRFLDYGLEKKHSKTATLVQIA
jgi:hypothetical protein